MTDPITAAREALAEVEELVPAGHVAALPAHHLRAALARVDELTAEVERLRLAGVTATRGTECHIMRGRSV